MVVLAVFFARSALERTLERQVNDVIEQPTGIDFFIESPTIIRYDDNTGVPESRVAAARLNYYADTRETELVSPVFDIKGLNYSWQVAANHALQAGSEQPVTLQGDVVITKTGTDDPVELITQDLVIDTESHVANTAAVTKIIARDSSTQSNGLKVNFKTNTVDLVSKVSTTISVSNRSEEPQ